MIKEVRIATRDSALALWQANWVKDSLSEIFPDITFSLLTMKTQGDKILDVALAKIGDKGLFTKELEIALLDGRAHMAVHSMKDVPTALPEGLKLGAIAQRHDPRDVLISPQGYTLMSLPQGARVGTSSLRRRAQLAKLRPDLQILDLRGNLNTRFAKLDRGDYDAMMLAAAGVERLGWAERISERIDFSFSLPAVGQGSVGIEIKEDDPEIAAIVAKINHFESAAAIRAERAMLKKLEGGCQIPIGSLGTVEGDQLRLDGLVASVDGSKILRATVAGKVDQPEELGITLAHRLLEMGAGEILAELRQE
ncbi:MAG TPA: hydroxymethylbilane synthase [Verrucomicrobiae bacterium]|nr:hydroxymethylbilane synthase [Verrucomicrobiae bacterium]